MIVCKFGGTSVGDAAGIARTAAIIASRRERQPIVVVSALGGTTNTLLQIAEQAAKGQLIGALSAVEGLRDRHLAQTETLLADDPAACADISGELSAMFDDAAIVALRGDPSKFLPGRHHLTDTKPKGFSPFLFFGNDGHECMGRYLSPIILQKVLTHLLKLKNLQRANDDPFDPLDLRPEHFLLEFDPS